MLFTRTLISIRLVPLVQMHGFRSTFTHANSSKQNKEDEDKEPEVWKYLGDTNENTDRALKQKRLENARKFLKMSQSRSFVKARRNEFVVYDIKEAVCLEDIKLPPVPQQGAGPPSHPSRTEQQPVAPAPPVPQPTGTQAPPPPPPQQSRSSRRTRVRYSEVKTGSFQLGDHRSQFFKTRTRQEFLVNAKMEESEGTERVEVNRLRSVREWVHTGDQTQNDQELKFRLLSYNVLAQNLLEQNPQLYRGADPNHLAWENRWKFIQEEIRFLAPDIVCLQEVQFRRPNHFRTHYLPFFENLGYRAVFKSRTGDKQDGCVIFYKMMMFKLDTYSLIEYSAPGIPVLDRDNIGIVCRLIPRRVESVPNLVVGTTHLLFNKKRTDIRLAQIGVFLAELDRLSFRNGAYCPAIITGDFNSGVQSEVYQLVSQGEVYYEGLAAGQRSMPRYLLPPGFGLTDTCQWEQCLRERNQAPAYGSGSFSHRFQFRSVYQEWEHPQTQNKVVSTNHGDWTLVDFIFYSESTSSLQLLSRFILPREQDMERIGRIPSDICPSDHFPLLAEFILKSTS